MIGCASTTGLGTNTALIYSPSGLFGGKYVPTVMSGLITPRSSMMNGNYINLLNGIILQWYNLGSGSVNSQSSISQSWIFPIFFSSTCIYAYAVCFSNTSSNVAFTSVGLTSMSSFGATFAIGNSSMFIQQWTNLYVFAIGY